MPSDEQDYLNSAYKKAPKPGTKTVKPDYRQAPAATPKAPVAARPQQQAPAPAQAAPATSSPSPFSIASGVEEAQPYKKIFLYAKYGHGKTVMAAQAVDIPELRDVIFINVEGGTQSILGSKAVKNHQKIDFVPSQGSIRDYETFVAIHRMLMAYCQARDSGDRARLTKMAERYGFNPAKTYRTVIIDTLSELNTVSLARAFGEKTDDLMSITDSDDTRRDYGRNKQSMLKIIRAFRNLDMNVIVTCGADWDKNEDDRDKRPKYYPKLTGALAQEVQAFWDVVGFLYSPGREPDAEGQTGTPVESRLYLQPGPFWDAKNRLAGRHIRYIDNPTMAKLISLLDTGETEERLTTAKSPK